MSDDIEISPSGPAPSDEVGQDMHIHKPKPLHSLREFLSEIIVIVAGIVIALGGEQVVEAIHWHHKVESAEAAIRTELGDDLRFAVRVEQFDPCAGKFLDALEAAVISSDAARVRKLESVDPFPPAPWSSSTFTAAISSQIEDHLPVGRMAEYSREFTWVPLQMEYQIKLFDELATATSARFALPRSPEIVAQQLAAIERLRSDESGRVAVAQAMLSYAKEKLSLTPSHSATDRSIGGKARACEAQVAWTQATAQR